MRHVVFLRLLAVLGSGLSALSIHSEGMAAVIVETQEAARHTTTVEGEIIDPALYLREGRHGPDVEDLISQAAHAGQTLALLEEGTETVYLFLASESRENPNEFLYDHIGHRVSVTGFLYERGGLTGIVPTDILPLETEEPPQPPASQQDVVE